MKRLISVILLIAVLLTCASCGKKEQAAATTAPAADTAATLDPSSPEAMYGHIDQTVPMDGVYKIWNAEGVKNVVNHPDAKFELLCNVDMGGAEIAPFGSVATPFTGTFDGGFFTISNFTLAGGADGAFGLFGVNKGDVLRLYVDGVSFKIDSKATNIGAFAGINEGKFTRCTLAGSPMDLAVVAENANCGAVVGTNSGVLNIVNVTVDINYTASAKANVGGIAGVSKGGHMEYVDTCGKLQISSENVNYGLYTGVAEDTSFLTCCFIGETNEINGKLFTNFFGTESNVTYENCLWRDNEREPLPENVQKLRNTVVQKMYDMGSVEWHVDKELLHTCKCGTTYVCDGVYMPGYTYIGMPYKHGSGNLDSMYYVLDENHYMKDFIYEMDSRNGFDSYIGSMCSSASQMAWWSVSNSVNHMVCLYMLPPYPEYGVIPVGQYWYQGNVSLNSRADTVAYIENCTEQEYYEDMAMVRPGDCVVNGLEEGDHVRMVSQEPVVVRDQDGKIDGTRSYVQTHEQRGSYILDEINNTWTSWKLDFKYTFAVMRGDWYLPVTCEELLTGEMEPSECAIVDGVDGKMGMVTGTVKSNYNLDVVTMVITDEKGNVVMDQTLFPKISRFDSGNARTDNLSYCDSFNLANFSQPLQSVQFNGGETYTYTLSAKLATGDTFTLKTDSFTQGG